MFSWEIGLTPSQVPGADRCGDIGTALLGVEDSGDPGETKGEGGDCPDVSKYGGNQEVEGCTASTHPSWNMIHCGGQGWEEVGGLFVELEPGCMASMAF